jgi:hypothetical protein
LPRVSSGDDIRSKARRVACARCKRPVLAYLSTALALALALALAVLAVVLALTGAPASYAAEAGVNVSPVVLEGLTSTKDHGVVKVQADPTLAEGRLVLKVVVFNRMTAASSFGPDDVKISTAAGQAIPLMTLEQLVQEARAGAPSSSTINSFGTSGPTLQHDAAGRPDVGNFTGGNSSMAGSSSVRTRPDLSKSDDPQVQQQIAALSAAILQPTSVAPAAAVGGQVVTNKIEFGRKEERALRVTVEFNGEQHVFEFAAPGER